MVLLVTGCQEKLGGGSSTIVSGTSAKTYVYGIRSGQQLGFVIFPDFAGEALAGSSWTGHIKPKEGPVVQYEGDTEGIIINGTDHRFSDGKVFLVETPGGTVSVRQLNLPIGVGDYEAEIERILDLEDVQKFLSK